MTCLPARLAHSLVTLALLAAPVAAQAPATSPATTPSGQPARTGARKPVAPPRRTPVAEETRLGESMAITIGRPGAIPALPAPMDTSALRGLRWREIGPFRGGRSVAVAGSDQRPAEYYMGTTGGGVFRTTDAGQTWAAVTDKTFGGTIGAIAVAPSNPDIVYVGTGEYPIRGNVSHGDGVFKSTDAGRTWRYAGLGDARQIARVRVHPSNPDLVYVAVQGNVWGPSGTRGIYRSRDGGGTWQRILFRDSLTGAADLTMDPLDPNTLYAGFWTAWRKPWELVSGGAGSGLFKSTDGGDTWTDLTRNAGLPKGLIGNVGISASGAKRGVVYAILEADSGGVFRSDDGGRTWRRTNDERKLRQRAWYYTKIHADPKDADVVYVNNVQFQKSSDGGKTFRAVRTMHADSHDLWIAPGNPQRMIQGDDGGASVSENGGRTWTEEDYATAQFYHVTTTTHFPYQVCGAQQDNSTLCGPNAAEGGVRQEDWEEVGGGESGYIAARPDRPDIVYAGSYGGYLTRKDRRTGTERNVNPWPLNPMGHSAGDLRYRFQWTFPIVVSSHDPTTVYAAANVLFRTTDEGQSWTAISGDLTRHDPKTLGPSGGPITKDQTSVEYYGTIFAVAESPLARGTIWTGSDDGLVHLTRDGGRTWTNVTPKELPAYSRISTIEASRHAPGTAYLAANRYQLDDMSPWLFRTTDHGRTWTRIDRGIAPTEFTRVIREDPVRPGLLYAGTERGVWVSFDDGAGWQRLQLNLPLVPVHDLAIAEGDLVAGTHGRSFWVLDGLTTLRQLAPDTLAKPAHLFQPQDAYRIQWGNGNPAAAHHPTGQNPPSGAVIHYWLKTEPREVTLDFLDGRGRVIRSFTSTADSATRADSIRGDSLRRTRRDSLAKAGIDADSLRRLEAAAGEGSGVAGGGGADEDGPRRQRTPRVPMKQGLNQFAWNLRYPDASTFEGIIMWAGGTQGPVAPPGTYAVRMTVDGDTATRTTRRFVVLKDPRTTASPTDLAEQFALLLKIRDRTSEANDAVRTIRNVRAQLAEREARIPEPQRAPWAAIASPLRERLERIENEIYQTRNRSGQDPLNYPIRLNNQISALANVVSSTEAKPTQQAYTVFTMLSMELDKRSLELRELLTADLVRANELLRGAGLQPIVPSTAEVASADGRRGADEEEEEAGEKPKRW